MKTFQFLEYQTQKHTAVLTIVRPKQLNALNTITLKEIREALLQALSDTQIRVVIITGSGSKAFVAGADIKEFAHFNAKQGKELAEQGQTSIFDFIENYPKPIIAAINGFALGGGLELALASTVRIASSNAKFGLPEVGLGLIPGYGGTQRLPEIIGKGRALEMMLTADMIDASKALDYGLITEVTFSDKLLESAHLLADRMAKNSPSALTSVLKAVHYNSHRKDGYALEKDLFGACFDTSDFKEGVTAFLEGRKPKF